MLLVPGTLAGQTVGTATGSIVGTVTDSTGAVLSGVTITAVSDALMGQRIATTDSEGHYRIVALAPGNYDLSFVLAGFRTTEANVIRIAVGFTATIDVVLPLVTVSEGVTVPARSGFLDRHATAVSYTFDSLQVLDLPAGRDMTALAAATPGVDPADAWLAYGTRGSNRPTVEGILVTGIRSTSFTLDDGSFEEVSVATAAHGPQFAAPGVHQQFISRSGGNRYRGRLYTEYQNGRWQSHNIAESQIRRGASTEDANRRWHEHDINADIGGFIVKDRLWWYSSLRNLQRSERLVNFTGGEHRIRSNDYTGKGTYRMSPRNTFTVFGQFGRHHEPNRLDAFTSAVIHGTEASTADERGGGRVWKSEWNAALSDVFLLEVRVGEFASSRDRAPNGAAPRFEDSATLQVRGGNRDWSINMRRTQWFVTASHFTDGRTGSHHLKAGAEVFRWTEGESWHTGYPGNVLHVLSNGAPREVYLFHTPSHSESGLWTYAIHASDSWQVTDRLALNLGLRLDRNRVFLPAQAHPPTGTRFAAVPNLIAWNTLVPRVGAVYNLTRGDATLLKVSYGKYRLPPGLTLGANANPNSPVWWSRYAWTDPDGSGTWQPGEETGSPFTRGGIAVESVDPGTKLPVVDEFGVWLERDLPGRIGFRTGGVWRSAGLFFARQTANWPIEAFDAPVLLPDPGPDGVRGNADDGPVVRTFTLPPELILLRGPNVVRNVPRAESDSRTWDVAVTRRFHRRWSMTAAFTRTWHREQAAGYAGQTVRNNAFALTPSDLINTGAGGRHEFTTWTAKAYGTCALPLGVRITPLVQHYSGQPFGRTFETRDLGYGRVVVLAEPVGTRRMQHLTTVDLRVEKRIPLRGNRRLAGFVDVLNLLNANTETRVSWLSGSDFLRPLAITPPRAASVGVKIDW